MLRTGRPTHGMKSLELLGCRLALHTIKSGADRRPRSGFSEYSVKITQIDREAGTRRVSITFGEAFNGELKGFMDGLLSGKGGDEIHAYLTRV